MPRSHPLVLRFHVARRSGPFKAGWWLMWSMKERRAPLIALLDPEDTRSVVGAWGTDAIPDLIIGLDDDAIRAEDSNPDFLAFGQRVMTDVTDFSGVRLDIAS